MDLKRELEQRLVDANSKTQHTLADLRQEWDARAAQVPRHGQHAIYCAIQRMSFDCPDTSTPRSGE